MTKVKRLENALEALGLTKEEIAKIANGETVVKMTNVEQKSREYAISYIHSDSDATEEEFYEFIEGTKDFMPWEPFEYFDRDSRQSLVQDMQTSLEKWFKPKLLEVGSKDKTLKCVVCGGELKEEETNICDYTCKDCDCMQNANGIVFSDLPFYLANYDTDKNIEIFQDFDKAKKESINGKVYKATLNHTNVWFEDGKWNYEDDSFLFADEPLEVMSTFSLQGINDHKILSLLDLLSLSRFNEIDNREIKDLLQNGLTDNEYLLYNMIKFRIDPNWNPIDSLSQDDDLCHFWNKGEEDSASMNHICGFNNGGDLENPKFQTKDTYYDCVSPVIDTSSKAKDENIEIFAKVEYVRNVVITNIKWDTDNESVDLPKFVNMSLPMSIFDGEDNEYTASEYMSEKLSADYGFCHCGFDDNFNTKSFFKNSFQDYMYENGNYVPEGARIGIEHNGAFVLDKGILNADVPRSAYLESKNQAQTGKCIYCEDSKQTKDLHFACEICGNGMCDECYDQMTEHDGHYNLPLENCDSDLEIKLIAEACGNDNPDYICESCMTKVMTNGKIAFIKKDLEKLVGTRWECREDLEKHLNKIYEIDSKLNKVDKSELLNDYAFTMSIFKNWGTMDIYYLEIPYGEDTIYITEVNVSKD